jgi:hypothetical protein
MIETNVSKNDEIYTSGFGVSSPAPLLFEVEYGEFSRIVKDVGETEHRNEDGDLERIEHYNNRYRVVDMYPPFDIEIEPDPEFDVIYDVYLIDQPSTSGETVHLSRTVMGGDDVAFYKGEDKIQHCIMTMQVPPNATASEEVKVVINTLELNEDAQNW